MITPAYLITLPTLSTNFKNFDNTGLDLSKQHGAFAKITASTKNFNSDLAYNHNDYIHTYKTINDMITLDSYNLESTQYGLTRTDSLTSLDSLLTNGLTFLDSSGKARFLESRASLNNESDTKLSYNSTDATVVSSEHYSGLSASTDTFLSKCDNQKSSQSSAAKSSSSYVDLISKQTDVNTDSILSGTLNNLTKLNYTSSQYSKSYDPAKPNPSSDDSSFLQSEQSLRAYPELSVSKSNVNFSGEFTPLNSYLYDSTFSKGLTSVLDLSSTAQKDRLLTEIKPSLKGDNDALASIQERRTSLGFPRTASLSNNVYLGDLNFDELNSQYSTTSISGPQTRSKKFSSVNTDAIRMLQGDVANTLPSIFSAY